MGKKGKTSSGSNYVSQGQVRNDSKKILNAVRNDRTEMEHLLNKQQAWLKGSNPWVTVENPNKEETNKKFIKVRMNDLMHGTAKDREKRMFVLK